MAANQPAKLAVREFVGLVALKGRDAVAQGAALGKIEKPKP